MAVLAEGQVWRYVTGTEFIVTNIHIGPDGSGRCRITNKSNGHNHSNEYRTSHFSDHSQWTFIAEKKKKLADSYTTLFCSAGCGEIKLVAPGEDVSTFTCKSCEHLARLV